MLYKMLSAQPINCGKLHIPRAPVMIVPADIETIVEVFIVLCTVVDMRTAKIDNRSESEERFRNKMIRQRRRVDRPK